MVVQPNVGSTVSLAAMEQAEALPPPAGGLAWPGGGSWRATGNRRRPAAQWPAQRRSIGPALGGQRAADSVGRVSVDSNRPISPTGEPGLGRERVMFAPFEIDITQTFGNFLLRSDAAYNLTKPDRAEYFWARPGAGRCGRKAASIIRTFIFGWRTATTSSRWPPTFRFACSIPT